MVSSAHANSCEPARTSIYYTPTMNQEKVVCNRRPIHTVVNYKGQIVRDCKKLIALLNEEGAGVVRDQDGTFQGAYTYQGPNRFALSGKTNCPMGFGNRPDICLNPFRTLAAHMGSGYKRGDVIFVPQTVNMKYPLYPNQPQSEWATHDGYWIVGDSGGKIVGRGRFDFFSGSMDWRDPQNPLTKLGFGDKQTTYCKVTSEKALSVKKQLGFPGLSPEIQTALLQNRAPLAPSENRETISVPNAENRSFVPDDTYSVWSF